MFQGLQELYSLDLQGNRLEQVENKAFANLPALRHLDIRFIFLKFYFFRKYFNEVLGIF